MKEKIFVAQPYQEGTSFSEITKGVEKCINESDLDVNVLKFQYSQNNKTEGLLDNADEISLHAEVISSLLRRDFSHALFLDFFAPGLDTIALLRSIKNTREKLGALLHGGTFLEGDIYQWEWLKKAEKLWFEIFDVIYVPSKFLYDQVPDEYRGKIKVFPWGLDNLSHLDKSIEWENREIDIVFPHRIDKDKGVDDLIKIIDSFPEKVFAVTIPQEYIEGNYFKILSQKPNCRIILGENDDEHFKTLQNSKVIFSAALQENFGYSLLKGVCAGCIPVVPDRLVYPEFIPREYCYRGIDSAKDIIFNILSQKKPYSDSLSNLKARVKNFSFNDMLKDFYEY